MFAFCGLSLGCPFGEGWSIFVLLAKGFSCLFRIVCLGNVDVPACLQDDLDHLQGSITNSTDLMSVGKRLLMCRMAASYAWMSFRLAIGSRP